MLNSYKKLLKEALKKKFAIPQFNINNLTNAKWILEECEKMKSPVFIGVSTGTVAYMGGYNVVRKSIDGLINDLKITVPIILHLDHGKKIQDIRKAVKSKFDSVMFDGSEYGLEKNIKLTNAVKKISKNVLLEAEIGKIGKENACYTTLESAITFSKGITIDMLAPAVGSVHGLYKEKPNIQFKLINDLKKETGCPLVLHGGTGLNNEIIKKSIKNGVCKINFNTELQIEWTNAVRKFLITNKEVYDPRQIISSGEQAFKKIIKEKIILLGSNNKG